MKQDAEDIIFDALEKRHAKVGKVFVKVYLALILFAVACGLWAVL